MIHQIIQEHFDTIPKESSIIVAVSGGSDSVALLLLANIWAKKHNAHLQAITIDHGLRPEAAAEAAFVASLCAGLDIDHVTLAWEGVKPLLGIQNAARQSRYHLLNQFAHEIGADVILTGHTLDDQIETVYMRNQRHNETGDGSGISGMAQNTWLFGGTQIIRPLLKLTRSELQGILSQFSQTWIEDPSNLDESYERVRVRKLLSSNPILSDNYAKLSDVCGRFRKVTANDCANYLAEHLKVHAGPVFELGLKKKDLFPSIHFIVLQAIQKTVGLAGGQEYLTSLKRLLPAIKSLLNGEKTKVTIGSCVVELLGKDDELKLRLYREMRNISSMVLEPGEIVVWDGRMHVHNETASTVFIEAAKKRFLDEYEEKRGEEIKVFPRQALSSTPVIHLQTPSESKSANIGACLPLVDPSDLPRGLHVRLATPSIEHFCPQFDVSLRKWVLSLDRFSAASISPKS